MSVFTVHAGTSCLKDIWNVVETSQQNQKWSKRWSAMHAGD